MVDFVCQLEPSISWTVHLWMRAVLVRIDRERHILLQNVLDIIDSIALEYDCFFINVGN